jgi:hypothetical protein
MSWTHARFTTRWLPAACLGLFLPMRAPACAYPGCVVGRYIPAVAHARGARGAKWITDLRLLNTGTDALPITLTFLPPDRDNEGDAGTTITVPPLQSVLLPDVVAQTFNAEGGGAIWMTTPFGSGHFLAEARTYDASSPELGTRGFTTQAVDGNSASSDSFLFVSNEPGPLGFRTNIGCVNPLSVAVLGEITLQDATGKELGASTVGLGTDGYAQVNDVFAALGLGGASASNGIVRIHAHTWVVDTPTSPVPVFGYATVIENRSNDPSFSLAAPDPPNVPPPPNSRLSR